MHDDERGRRNNANTSRNRPFKDVLHTRSSRRHMLAGGLATAATAFVGGPSGAYADERFAGHVPPLARRKRTKLIDFTPIAVAEGNAPWPTISPDYEFQVLIPWGESLVTGGPSYDGDPTSRPDALEQTMQIGIGHDGMWYFPMERHRNPRSWSGDRIWWDDGLGWWSSQHAPEGNTHGLLLVNHEFGTNEHLLGKPMPESLSDVRLAQHAHGVSVVEIKKIHDTWRRVSSNFARRIHGNTPMRFSGPAAGHALLETPAGNEPAGTLNNCASGHTPWGTYLTCEENFNGYFGANGAWSPTPAQRRYGFSADGFGYGWHLFDDRFDLSNPDYRNEENRFGWVVEIDPFDDSVMPVKRTALGRFKHEGAQVVVANDGRAVVYMGDDEADDYIYKFVSSHNWKLMRMLGLSPLDHGKLYVARFGDDGSGEWLELTIENPVLASQFADQAEIVTYTRLAADLLGATPMDRPEWAAAASTGDVYFATNNSRRTMQNGPNPLAPNRDGHVIKLRDSNRHVGTKFRWDVFLIAAVTHGTEEAFPDPDGLWADRDGRLFIQTDGGQPHGLNNQMVVADTLTGEVRRLFTGVTGDEVTGIALTPDRRTVFVNIQHPGNGDPAVSKFPKRYDGVTAPRDATVVITRKDGGIIGS